MTASATAAAAWGSPPVPEGGYARRAMSFDAHIAVERAKLLHQHGRTGWMVHMLILATTTVVLWHPDRAGAIAAWLAAMAAITLWRARRCRAFPAEVTPEQAADHLRHYNTMILATGIGWGVASVLLFHPDDNMRQVFLAFIIGGTGAGAVATLSPSLPTLRRALLPSLPVLGAVFAVQGGLPSVAIGMLVFVHCLALLAVGRTLGGAVESSLRLGLEKEALAAELTATLEAMSDGVALVDADGRVKRANARLAELLGGEDAAALTGRRLDGVLPRPDAAGPRALMTAAGYVVDIRAQPFPDGGAVITVSDVTERARTEDGLREARQRAEAALAAKARFMARASHDLRQPLHAIGLFAGRLSEVVRGREARSLLRRITGSVTAMTGLFDALLDVSKLDAGVVTPVRRHLRAGELLRQVAAEFEPTAAAKGLSLRVVDCSAVILSDPVLLGRVLRNLVSNAVAHTSGGRVLMGCRRDGGTVRLQVWDTGPGIPPERLEEAFEDFSRLRAADGETPGLGLGLAVVRRTLDLLGNRLRVDTLPGRGSLFEVTVPAGEEALVEPLAGQEGVVVERPLHTPRVLVVDDDAATLAGMAALLQSWGCAVATARALDELMPWAPVAPDLVLADLRLASAASGLEVVRRLREAYGRDVPAAIITAETSEAGVAEVIAAGLPVLRKPASPARLRALVLHLQSGAPAAAPAS